MFSLYPSYHTVNYSVLTTTGIDLPSTKALRPARFSLANKAVDAAALLRCQAPEMAVEVEETLVSRSWVVVVVVVVAAVGCGRL